MQVVRQRGKEEVGTKERESNSISSPHSSTSQLFSIDADSIRMSHSRSRPIIRLGHSRLKYNDAFNYKVTGGFFKEFIKYSFHRPIDKIPEY